VVDPGSAHHSSTRTAPCGPFHRLMCSGSRTVVYSRSLWADPWFVQVQVLAHAGGWPLHTARHEFGVLNGGQWHETNCDSLPPGSNLMPASANQMPAPGQTEALPTNRVVSGIAKGGTDGTWVYPSVRDSTSRSSVSFFNPPLLPSAHPSCAPHPLFSSLLSPSLPPSLPPFLPLSLPPSLSQPPFTPTLSRIFPRSATQAQHVDV
jgi:hypothetical protein